MTAQPSPRPLAAGLITWSGGMGCAISSCRNGTRMARFTFTASWPEMALKLWTAATRLQAGRPTICRNGRWLYNGTAVVWQYAAAVAYCCKYIGKQAGERPLGRWYYSGGDLKEPQKIYADLDFRAMDGAVEFNIPGAALRVKNGVKE